MGNLFELEVLSLKWNALTGAFMRIFDVSGGCCFKMACVLNGCRVRLDQPKARHASDESILTCLGRRMGSWMHLYTHIDRFGSYEAYVVKSIPATCAPFPKVHSSQH